MTATPLERRLKATIQMTGPLSVADWMALCLGDPEHGYYMAREPFGAKGDFITAPDVSQMFGELIGAWLIDAHQRIGAPAAFDLVELGPGRGTLMADIWRTFRLRPPLQLGARLTLVETSPRLRARQQDALATVGAAPRFADRLDALPRGRPLLLVANEFLDALPIRQWVRHQGVWRERVVGLDAEGALAFGLGAAVLPQGDLPQEVANASDGAILETAAPANAVVETIARRIVDDGGAALFIDYGYTKTAIGDTLQAVRAHEHRAPLDRPGETDITAHVNFEAIARAAHSTGALVHGPATQGAFLSRLGLLDRAARLGTGKDPETQARLAQDVERLAGAEEMGILFKVMAVSSDGIELAGF